MGTLEPVSYIDEELVERRTDLLFRADIAGTEACFYLLFEHQSEPDARMPFRLLRYMIRIWEQIERASEGKVLPAIIPVVSRTVNAAGRRPRRSKPSSPRDTSRAFARRFAS